MTGLTVTILVGLLMLVGLFGVVAPIIPDAPLIWLGALGYGLLVGWGPVGGYLFAGITGIAVISGLAEIWASGIGARAGGASLWGLLGGVVLGLIGLVFFTPIGGLVGLLLGTFLVEFYRVRDSRRALRGMLGLGAGYGAAFFVKLFLSLVMIALWVIWVVTLASP